MQPDRLPATPMETLSISGALRAAVKTIHTLARLFKFWDHPLKNGTSDFEEWTLWEKMYWGYKSKNPVLLAEQGSNLETLFQNNEEEIKLPDGLAVENSLTFAGVGDLIKVEGLENSLNTFYEEVNGILFEKDITYGNLESQLTRQDISAYVFSDKETPPLCCTPAQYETIKSHKDKQFTILHTACNHTLDMGLEGLETTLSQLEKDNIIYIGTQRQQEEQFKGRIIIKNGIKLGFVGATYGLNGKAVPAGKEWLVSVVKFHNRQAQTAPVDITLLKRQITDCQLQGCDLIIASLHWGYEYEFMPRQAQVEMAHELIEAGVDVIIGHHSHVLQPVEFYKPKRDRQRTGIIVYSLGNLTSYYSAPHLILSGIINLRVVKGKVNGETKTYISEVTKIPVVQREKQINNLRALGLQRLEDFLATEEEAAKQAGRYAQWVGWKKKP